MLDMSMVRIKYVHSFVDRHGHARHYFRRHGKKTALPGEPGTIVFQAAYSACRDGQPSAKPAPRPKIVDGSLSALALAYFGSVNFAKLSTASRTNYRRVIERFVASHGHRQVGQMRRENVIKIIGGMADRPGAGIILLKRIRLLMRFAIDLGWIEVDPTNRVASYSSEEWHTWTEEELAQFEARWPIGTTQRLAYALCLYTGQRGSDVRRMAWADVVGGSIRVAQQKTKAKLLIPLHPELSAVLATVKREHLAIIVTAYGAPFSVKGFGQKMADAITDAGLADRCVTHGLRKAAARRLAEAGCTGHEIMSVTGHKTLAEVERYTRAADQIRLGQQAIAKQVRNK